PSPTQPPTPTAAPPTPTFTARPPSPSRTPTPVPNITVQRENLFQGPPPLLLPYNALTRISPEVPIPFLRPGQFLRMLLDDGRIAFHVIADHNVVGTVSVALVDRLNN